MKNYLFLLSFLTVLFAKAQTLEFDKFSPIEDYNFVLGTQALGAKYQFGNESSLMEQSKQIRALGSNILKISLGKKAPKNYRLGVKDSKTTLELFKSSPEFKKAFDMDFKYIFVWVHTMTGVEWKKKMDTADQVKIYNEMYELAVYILKEYNNTGKTFMIGNWEGDWLLHPNYNREFTPPKNHVDNMTKWFEIRQKAIDDAKANVKHKNVSLYHYIELNLALKGIKGEVCIAESILPNVNVDFVSYSSYEAIKNRTYDEKKEQLAQIFTYLESKLKPKENLPFTRRVFLGEYGYHANINKPESFKKQFDETLDIMKITFELNLPFALHWQMYNNEYDKNGVSKEMSLVNEKGEKMPLYFCHQSFYVQMNAFVKEFKMQNKKAPSEVEFATKALEVLNTMSYGKY